MIRKANGRYWQDGIEITSEEYEALHALFSAKTKWVNNVFSGAASIEDCPKEWKEEVSKRVKEMQDAIDPDPEIDEAEVCDILFGGAE